MQNKFYGIGIFMLSIFFSSSAFSQFSYISPVPGAKYVNPGTSIILRADGIFDAASLSGNEVLKVEGSISGIHSFKTKLAEKGQTLIIQPLENFTEGETVTVSVSSGIRLTSGENIGETSFQFYTRVARTQDQNMRIAIFMKTVHDEDFPSSSSSSNSELKPPKPPINGLPDYTINTNTTTSTGQIFFSDFNYYVTDKAYYCIIDNNGDSVLGRMDTVTFNNFDLNKNGYMTAYNDEDSSFIMFDSNYAVIAVYQMGNGYTSDVHEFQIFPDGTHYMLCYDPQIVDMTVYNPNYNPAAVVIGAVLQKLDAQNNVVFEWRSWDHIDILDADHINFANSEIDAVHSNAIDVDHDGNILLTCRHLSEIVKINALTGDVMWRFGGGVGNQFTFLNDPDKISWPHDGRRIANGNITVFDNGNYHSPWVSYGKEYQLDEENMTATLVWSYKRSIPEGDINSKAMGNVQRLPNGNSLICWGLVNTLAGAPKITEVDSLGNIVWELQLADQDAVYRAHRHDWVPCARPSNSTIKVSQITATSAKFTWKPATNSTSYDVQYRPVGSNTWNLKNFGATSAKVKALTPATKYEYQVRTHCNNISTQLSAWTATKKFKTLPQRLSLNEDAGLTATLYPNPTQNDLMISIQSETPQSVTVSILDASGKMMMQESKQVDEGEQDIQINAASLPAGFYFAEIASSSGKEVKKFMKQ